MQTLICVCTYTDMSLQKRYNFGKINLCWSMYIKPHTLKKDSVTNDNSQVL